MTAEGDSNRNNSKYILLKIIKILETLKPEVDEIKQPPKKDADNKINTIFLLQLFVKFIPEFEIEDDKYNNLSEILTFVPKIYKIMKKNNNK